MGKNGAPTPNRGARLPSMRISLAADRSGKGPRREPDRAPARFLDCAGVREALAALAATWAVLALFVFASPTIIRAPWFEERYRAIAGGGVRGLGDLYVGFLCFGDAALDPCSAEAGGRVLFVHLVQVAAGAIVLALAIRAHREVDARRIAAGAAGMAAVGGGALAAILAVARAPGIDRAIVACAAFLALGFAVVRFWLRPRALRAAEEGLVLLLFFALLALSSAPLLVAGTDLTNGLRKETVLLPPLIAALFAGVAVLPLAILLLAFGPHRGLDHLRPRE